MIFEIHPDIKKAETLSSEFYLDDKYFHESKEKIFARSWQIAGTTNEVKNVKPTNLMEGFLDEPILITKIGNEFQCVSNVCTHRGNILVQKVCDAKGIRCAYHGRRFDLSGKFLSMPEFEKAKNFPSEKDDLPKIPFNIWHRFMFASIDPAATLSEFLGEMPQKVGSDLCDQLNFRSKKVYTVNAHWALYCENYLEGFHIPFIHSSLNEVVDYGTYKTETFRFSSLQTGFDSSNEVAALYFFIFPNLMFNFYPWGLSVNIVKPLTKDLTIVEYLTFVSDEAKLGKGAGADLEKVEFEDQAVVESVQKGIRSRFYDKGRYSPTKEIGTHHFHRLIAEFMTK